tara:strand:- start:850 stop:1623 length:774 start_codon:yes stop_codon:yes gene_type:complete
MSLDLDRFRGDPDFMMSLARGLLVLGEVNTLSGPASLADLARRTGLSRGAARRALYTLTQLGYLRRSDEGYMPSNDVLLLGHGLFSPDSLPIKAQPFLDDLRNELNESCSIGIREGRVVRYIARAETRRIISINLKIGSRLPLYATSMGRVLLAACSDLELESYLQAVACTSLTHKTETDKDKLRLLVQRTRNSGYALVDQELELGLRSIAVPIVLRNDFVAALNVAVSAQRIRVEQMENEFLPKLKSYALRIADTF